MIALKMSFTKKKKLITYSESQLKTVRNMYNIYFKCDEHLKKFLYAWSCDFFFK